MAGVVPQPAMHPAGTHENGPRGVNTARPGDGYATDDSSRSTQVGVLSV
jgi:hypothetical protein